MRPNAAAAIVKYALIVSFRVMVTCLPRSRPTVALVSITSACIETSSESMTRAQNRFYHRGRSETKDEAMKPHMVQKLVVDIYTVHCWNPPATERSRSTASRSINRRARALQLKSGQVWIVKASCYWPEPNSRTDTSVQ